MPLGPCTHPLERRWQWNGWWECCRCLKRYWGLKTSTADPLPTRFPRTSTPDMREKQPCHEPSRSQT